MVAVDGCDAAAALRAAAVLGVVDLPFHHDERIGDAAVAHAAGIVEAAGVRSGNAVKIFDVFGHDVASSAVGGGDAAHDDAGGILHDHHVSGVALALDRLDDDAVAVIVGVENAVHVRPAVLVLRFGGIGVDRDQRGIRRGELHRLLDGLDLGDLLGREVDVREEFYRAGLAHRGDEQVARRLRGALGQHVHDAVERKADQQQRLKDEQQDPPQHAQSAAGGRTLFSGFFTGFAHGRVSFGEKLSSGNNNWFVCCLIEYFITKRRAGQVGRDILCKRIKKSRNRALIAPVLAFQPADSLFSASPFSQILQSSLPME